MAAQQPARPTQVYPMVARPIKQIPSPNDAVTEGRGRGAMGLRGPMAGQGEGASLHPSIGHRLGSIEHAFMMLMTLDHVGDQEAIVYAQLGQQPLARPTETSLERAELRDSPV